MTPLVLCVLRLRVHLPLSRFSFPLFHSHHVPRERVLPIQLRRLCNPILVVTAMPQLLMRIISRQISRVRFLPSRLASIG